MSVYVAFLRGMNLGKRRIKNPELCACFEDMGFTGVSAFLASGNVIFDGGGHAEGDLSGRIAAGLEVRLGYAVPTYLRSAAEVTAIAERAPFPPDALAGTAGKIQVALLAAPPAAATREAILAGVPPDDRLAFAGRELYWLPKAGMSTSELDTVALDRALGGMTVRTHRTLTRLVPRLG